MGIWNGIKRLFMPSGAGHDPQGQAPRPNDLKLEDGSSGGALSAMDLERQYIGLLLGVHSFVDTDLNKFERKALKAIESLLDEGVGRSGMVPQLPVIMSVAQQSVASASVNDAVKHITDFLRQDQILAKDIIRQANTPQFRSTATVNTLDELVAAYGLRGLRQIIAYIAIKPFFNMYRGHFGPMATPKLWAHAERCALACVCIAKQMHTDPYEAFLAGLTANSGLFIATQILDRVYEGAYSPHSVGFRRAFVSKSRRLSVDIARFWAFPEAVVDSLAQQISADEGEDAMNKSASVVYAGDRLAQLRVLAEAGRIDPTSSRFACRLGGALTDSCASCYAEFARFDP